MLATERLLEIEANFGELVESIVPVDLDGEMLRLGSSPQEWDESEGYRAVEWKCS